MAKGVTERIQGGGGVRFLKLGQSGYSKFEHIMDKELKKSGRRTHNKRQIKRKGLLKRISRNKRLNHEEET